jgi:hypothetical protein
MTVKELRDALANYPDERLVLFWYSAERDWRPCAETTAVGGAVCLYPSTTTRYRRPPLFAVGDQVWISGGPYAGYRGEVTYMKFSSPRGQERRWRYEVRRGSFTTLITVDEYDLDWKAEAAALRKYGAPIPPAGEGRP